MDGVLYCNDKKCHRAFTSDSDAWITSCSHIFCSEHFPSAPASVRKCPRCSKDLPARNDVHKKNLNPPDPLKSVILSGLSPSIVLETGFEALKFLNFQSFHEKMFLQTYIKRQHSKLAKSEVQQTEKETYYQEKIDELKNLIQQQTQKCENLERELNNQLRKTQHLEKVLKNSNEMLYKKRAKYESGERQPFDFSESRNLHRRGSFSYEAKQGQHNDDSRMFTSQHAPLPSYTWWAPQRDLSLDFEVNTVN